MIQRIMAWSAPPLLLTLVAVLVWIAVPAVQSVTQLNTAVALLEQSQSADRKLAEQRYQAALAAERFYGEQYVKLAGENASQGRSVENLRVRVDGLERRTDKLEDRLGRSPGRP
jgi:hypothetical protein